MKFRQYLAEAGTGDCFPTAGRAVLHDKTDSASLVHALVYGQGDLDGRRFAHAWVEMGDVVIDNSNGNKVVMRKNQYYKLGGIDENTKGAFVRYSRIQALLEMGKNKHWGPWNEIDLTLEESKNTLPDRKKEIGKRKIRIPSALLKQLRTGIFEDTLTEAPLTDTELRAVELFADRLFNKIGVDVEFSNHFKDRANDPRNKKQITANELAKLFRDIFKQHGKTIAKVGPGIEGILKDLSSKINIPFVLKWNRKMQQIDLVGKTVMRKAKFHSKSKDKVLAVEDILNEFSIKRPPKKDTLGIPRSKMPQVASKDYPELMKYFKDNGATLKKEKISANKLKAIQGEFADAGVEKALSLNHLKPKALIVSKNNFIIDGHHRWLAALNSKPTQQIPIIRVNMTIDKLLPLVLKFPKITFKDIYP